VNRKTLVPVFFILLFLSAFASTASGEPFESKKIHVVFSFLEKDLGTVAWGKYGETTLTVENREETQIGIQLIKCPCIDMGGNAFSIGPKQKKTFPVRFYPAGFSGADRKSIHFVMTSPRFPDSVNEIVYVKLYAVIDPGTINRPFTSPKLPVGFSFQGYDFGYVPQNSSNSVRLSITNHSGNPLTFRLSENYGCIVPSENGFTIDAGSNRTIRLNYTPARGEGVLMAGILNMKLDVGMFTDTNAPAITEEICFTAKTVSNRPPISAALEPRKIMPPRKRATAVPLPAGADSRTVTLFAQKGCKECMDLRALLIETISNRHYPFVLKELEEAENIPRIVYLQKEKHLDVNNYPVLIVGGTVISGNAARDANAVRTLLEDYRRGRIPDIDLFANYRETDKTKYVEQSASRITIPGILLIGMLDGVNPCAFATIVFLISYLAYIGRKRNEIVIIGIVYSAGVFLTYFLIGLGIFGVLLKANQYRAVSLTIKYLASGLLIVFAVLSLSDFVKALRGKASDMSLSLPAPLVKRIHKVIRENSRTRNLVISSFLIGVLVSFFELACTGQIYFPIIQAMIQTDRHFGVGVFYLILYCIAFIFPLLVIFAMNIIGITSKKMQDFLRKNVPVLKILMFAGFTTLAVYMLLG
jgi:cytochrome c biogenesis protein CcdA